MESSDYVERKKSFWRDDSGSVGLATVGTLLSGAGFLLTAAALYQGQRSTRRMLEKMNDTVKKVDKKSCLMLGATYLNAAKTDELIATLTGRKASALISPEEYVEAVKKASRLWETEV